MGARAAPGSRACEARRVRSVGQRRPCAESSTRGLARAPLLCVHCKTCPMPATAVPPKRLRPRVFWTIDPVLLRRIEQRARRRRVAVSRVVEEALALLLAPEPEGEGGR